MPHYYRLRRSRFGWRVAICARNNEVIWQSELYATRQGADRLIEKTAAAGLKLPLRDETKKRG